MADIREKRERADGRRRQGEVSKLKQPRQEQWIRVRSSSSAIRQRCWAKGSIAMKNSLNLALYLYELRMYNNTEHMLFPRSSFGVQ